MPPVQRRTLCGSALCLLAPGAAHAATRRELHGIGHPLAPLSYTLDGQVRGLCPDVLRDMAQQLHLSLNLEIQPLPRLLQADRLSETTVVFPISRQPDREQNFAWIGQVMPRRVRVYRLQRRPELQFAGLDRLVGKRLIANHGTATLRKLKETAGLRQEQIQVATGYVAAIKMLMAERGEFLVMNELAALWTLRQLELPNDTLTAVAEFDDSGAYWLCVKPGRPDWAAKLQEAFENLRAQGRLESLKKAYGL